jgi:hypothetical protein
MHDLCETFAASAPGRADDILFGAAACLLVDRRFAEYVLDRWVNGRSTLRTDDSDRLAATG